jgi:hypothetical protein
MAAYNKSLGKFQLTGIPPAPRGIPQIEVAFNIDASGILEVSAKDLGTGRDQRVEIKSGGGLSDDEIRRMVSDAESYAGEDTRERELAEARNAGESAVHQAERQIEELGEDIDAASRTEVETAIQQLRGALEFGDADYIRASTERLRAAFHDVAEAMYERAQAAAREPAPYEPGSFSEILQDTFVRRAPSPAEPEPEPPPAPSAEPAGDGPRWVAVINYRRDDSAEAAERLYDGLTRHFGEDRIFLDIKVPPGTDYRDEIEDAIASTGTVLVVIGPRWLTVADDAGRPRLQKRTDLVRAEIELALDTDGNADHPGPGRRRRDAGEAAAQHPQPARDAGVRDLPMGERRRAVGALPARCREALGAVDQVVVDGERRGAGLGGRRRVLRGAGRGLDAERLGELAGLVHLGDDVAPADQLALDEQLGDGRPLRQGGQLLADPRVRQDVDRRERRAGGLERRDSARGEAARGAVGGSLHEEDDLVVADRFGDRLANGILSGLAHLSLRSRFEGQRVDRPADVGPEHRIDSAVLLDPAQAGELVRGDAGPEVVPAAGEIGHLGVGPRDRRFDAMLELVRTRHFQRE